MFVTETDHDLLQTYLDGELPSGECERLWRRLAAEPNLAGELEQLRAGLEARREAWASFEPTELAVARAERDIVDSARRQQRLGTFWRLGRVASPAAACLLLGLWVGVAQHDRLAPAPAGTSPASAVTPASAQIGGGSGAPVTPAMNTNPAANGKVRVFFKDDAGKVIAVQDFENMEDAERFSNDVARAQQQRRESRDNLVIPVSNEAF